MTIFDSIRSGDSATLDHLLTAEPGLVHSKEQGWAPLHWAAGAGKLEIVTRLIATDTNVFQRGDDGRTSYQIALASGRREVAAYLRDLEMERDPAGAESSSLQWRHRAYCRGYRLGDLRKYSRWTEAKLGAEGQISRTDDNIVYIHQDFSVTETAVAKDRIVFESGSDDWRQFCLDVLSFRVATDLEPISDN